MSGFDLTKMLPLYLDECDEIIAALNDALLRLEQAPDDAKALQEAFRYVHTIKGSAALMDFGQVKDLTHELETIFDQLRAKKRTLDRSALNLFFHCLDGLRDYHQELRSAGDSRVDLSRLTAQVVEHLGGSTPAPPPRPVASIPEKPRAPETALPTIDEQGRTGLRVVFAQGIPLADMKAKLVLNRLATKARILRTEPAADQLDDVEDLRKFTIWLVSECSIAELRQLADVDGVSEVVELPVEVAGSGTAATPDTSSAIAAPLPAATAEPSEAPPPVPAVAVPTALETAAAPVEASDPKRTKVSETVRVDIDRLDSLMNLAGELVINKAHFLQITSGFKELFRNSNAELLVSDTQDRLDSMNRALDGLSIEGKVSDGAVDRCVSQFRGLRENFKAIHEEFELIREGRDRLNALAEAIDQLARVSDGIQKGVLNTRMVPIGPLFARFRRVVRDLSIQSDKEVTLEISGEKTELDKRMIDELGDPLIHMVRNSVDHGLETPEQRVESGKPRNGRVMLAAAHRGNSVVITVSDDGRGINCERIREKIVANGLVAEDEARRLSERELIQFIWHPGLSTAERITDVSGRGVGMDIVKSRIEGLNGSVDVRSTIGQGTTFTVRLPLTLAIMPSLLVRIYDEVYAIPLDHVDEIVETAPGQVHHIHGNKTLEIRKKIIGLVTLNDIFRWAGTDHPSLCPKKNDAVQGPRDKYIVVVVQNGETTIGIAVDHLIGMQEVVLKSLEKNFRSVPGLSGASILGDGRVSLILDIDAAMGMAASLGPKRRVSVGA